MKFKLNDIVTVVNSGASSMVHYAEHRTQFECPCHFRNQQMVITNKIGNYVFCSTLDNKKHSAFHWKDIELWKHN